MQNTSNTSTDSSLDALFAKLRDMKFDEAIDLAIQLSDTLPLGASKEERLAYVDYELQRFGWSYKKLVEENSRRIQAGIYDK